MTTEQNMLLSYEPHLDTLGKWLACNLAILDMPRMQLGNKLGVARSVVGSWCNEQAPVPFNRIAEIAKILGADPLYLRNLWIRQNMPTFFTAFGNQELESITQNEIDLIKFIRSVKRDNSPLTDKQKEIISKAFE